LKYVDPETFVRESGPPDAEQLLASTSTGTNAAGASGAAAAAPAKETKPVKRSYGWLGDKMAEGMARNTPRQDKPSPQSMR